jgi:hypothetical protein
MVAGTAIAWVLVRLISGRWLRLRACGLPLACRRQTGVTIGPFAPTRVWGEWFTARKYLPRIAGDRMALLFITVPKCRAVERCLVFQPERTTR